MLKDQIDLLSAFNAQGVEYLVVGGHAVYKALAQFGAPMGDLAPEDFIDKPEQFFQIGVEPHRVDLMQSIPGISFDEAWRDAVTGEVEGVPVRFLSREHLITNKLAVGRPRDRGDVDELRKFAGKS